MSLVTFTFNAIRQQVVIIDSKEWFREKEVWKVLENNKDTTHVVRARVSWENVAHKYQLTSCTPDLHPLNWPKDSQKHDLCIDEEGLRELVLSSQQPQAA